MHRFVGNIRVVWLLASPLAIMAIWLTATAFFGLAYFLSGRRVRLEEVIIFTVSFAIATASSAAIALLVGGKRRWAVEAAVPMATLVTVPVGLAIMPRLSG
jgi:hypothetical protein